MTFRLLRLLMDCTRKKTLFLFVCQTSCILHPKTIKWVRKNNVFKSQTQPNGKVNLLFIKTCKVLLINSHSQCLWNTCFYWVFSGRALIKTCVLRTHLQFLGSRQIVMSLVALGRHLEGKWEANYLYCAVISTKAFIYLFLLKENKPLISL